MSEPLATGAWEADPAASPPDTGHIIWAEGAILTRIGPGQVQAQLNRPTNACHFTGQVTLNTKPGVSVNTSVENTSDCIKTIWTTLANGTPVDAGFNFDFRRKG